MFETLSSRKIEWVERVYISTKYLESSEFREQQASLSVSQVTRQQGGSFVNLAK